LAELQILCRRESAFRFQCGRPTSVLDMADDGFA
jgi:hypothetical protein